MSLPAMNQLETNMANGILNVAVADGQFNSYVGGGITAFENALIVAFEICEEKAKHGSLAVVRWSAVQKYKVLAPLLGLSQSFWAAFPNLLLALGSFAITSTEMAASIAAGGPVGIALAALALLSDSIALGAAQGTIVANFESVGISVGDKHEQAMAMGRQRRMVIYLEQQFKRQQASRRPHPQ